MTDFIEGPAAPVPPRRRAGLSTRTGLIAAALLGVGLAGGATVAQMQRPSIEMAPTAPVAIRSLSDDGSIVTVRGRVTETYGPMLIVQDATGRTLVEGGPQVDGTGLVVAGQTVGVQGRFGHGLLHAAFLVGADGKVTALRPMGPPHGDRDGRGPGGPGGPGFHGRGPDGPDGPGRGPGGPGARDVPPPAAGAVPPPASGATPPPAAGVTPVPALAGSTAR